MNPIDEKAIVWYHIRVDKNKRVHKGTNKKALKTDQIEILRGLFRRYSSSRQRAFGAGNNPMVGATVAVAVAVEPSEVILGIPRFFESPELPYPFD